MPSERAVLISLISRMFFVPEVETTVRPLRSSVLSSPLSFLATNRVAVRKWVLVKPACFWRSTLLVVEPHSRSIVPLAISGMRVAEVTGLSLTSILSSFRCVLTASAIFWQISKA